jgi:fumarate reductase subunit D
MDEQTQNQAPQTADDRDAQENKYTALFSYIWILFLIPLLARRDSKFCQFHAKQGLVLFVIDLIASLFFWIPLIGQLLMLALAIVSVIGIIKVLNGEYWKIPYIYGWSEKIKI